MTHVGGTCYAWGVCKSSTISLSIQWLFSETLCKSENTLSILVSCSHAKTVNLFVTKCSCNPQVIQIVSDSCISNLLFLSGDPETIFGFSWHSNCTFSWQKSCFVNFWSNHYMILTAKLKKAINTKLTRIRKYRLWQIYIFLHWSFKGNSKSGKNSIKYLCIYLFNLYTRSRTTVSQICIS